MFVSVDYLVKYYDIDRQIAAFFVDRDPPVNNLYWHDKLLFLGLQPGYLFIPIITDILFRLGVSKEQLLTETYAQTLEAIGQIAALEETKRISATAAQQQCNLLVTEKFGESEWLTLLNAFLHGDTSTFFSTVALPFKALHRGDIFLYAVCSLDITGVDRAAIAQQWFSLIGSLLMLDDAEDTEVDSESGDLNVFLESGLNKEGVQSVREILDSNVLALKKVNPKLGDHVKQQFERLIQQPYVDPILRQ